MRLCQYFNAQNQQAFYWLDSIIIGSISLFGALYNIMTILRFFSLLDFAQFYQKINTFGFMWLYFVGFSRTKSQMTLFRGILTDEKSQVKNRGFLPREYLRWRQGRWYESWRILLGQFRGKLPVQWNFSFWGQGRYPLDARLPTVTFLSWDSHS